MNKMTFERIASILISLLCFSAYSTNANDLTKNIPHIEYIKPIELIISGEGINRISFAPMIATTIWGNATEYSALLSNNGAELFLSSKVETGKSFALAVQLAGGRVVDLLFHTVDVLMPNIIHLNLVDQNLAQDEQKLEIQQMIKAMRSGATGKYYITEDKQKLVVTPSLMANWGRVYRFKNLRGVVLQLTNIGKNELSTSARELAKSFSNVIGVQLNNELLMRGQSTNAFLVLKNGDES